MVAVLLFLEEQNVLMLPVLAIWVGGLFDALYI